MQRHDFANSPWEAPSTAILFLWKSCGAWFAIFHFNLWGIRSHSAQFALGRFGHVLEPAGSTAKVNVLKGKRKQLQRSRLVVGCTRFCAFSFCVLTSLTRKGNLFYQACFVKSLRGMICKISFQQYLEQTLPLCSQCTRSIESCFGIGQEHYSTFLGGGGVRW